jgi:hypothetical protein
MTTMHDKAEALESIRICGVKAGQVWRHVRTGGRYFVMAVGLDSETLSPVVVYEGNDGVAWSRPLALFLSRPNGQWRFINDDDAAVMTTAASFVDRSP